MWKHFRQQYATLKRQTWWSSGSTLIEILFATAVLGLVMTSIVSVITLSVKNTAESKERSLSTKYSQDGMEFFRQQREALGWETFVGSFPQSGAVATYCLASIPANLSGLQAHECDDTEFVDSKDIFLREADVSVSQNGSRQEVNVTITVTWEGGNSPKKTTVVQKFAEDVIGSSEYTGFPSPVASPSPSSIATVEGESYSSSTTALTLVPADSGMAISSLVHTTKVCWNNVNFGTTPPTVLNVHNSYAPATSGAAIMIFRLEDSSLFAYFWATTPTANWQTYTTTTGTVANQNVTGVHQICMDVASVSGVGPNIDWIEFK